MGDPEFKTWIAPVQGDDSKAHCKCCNTKIRAQLNVSKELGATKKCERVRSFAIPSGSGVGQGKKRREFRTATCVACHTAINAVEDFRISCRRRWVS